MTLSLLINKNGQPQHEIIQQSLAQTQGTKSPAPQAGMMLEIPRKLWKKKYRNQKLQPVFVDRADFWVAHIFVTAEDQDMVPDMLQAIEEELVFRRLKVCTREMVQYEFDFFPNFSLKNLPTFLQLSGFDESGLAGDLNHRLHDIKIRLEKMLSVEFLSFSNQHVIYKLPLLAFGDLKDVDCESSLALTYTGDLEKEFLNWQPFSNMLILGEIKDLKKIEHEASLLNIKFPEQANAPHKLGRLLEGLTQNFPVSLPEAQAMFWNSATNQFSELHSYYQKTMPLPQNSTYSAIAWDAECLIVKSGSQQPLYIEETQSQWLIEDSKSNTNQLIAEKIAFSRHPDGFKIKSASELDQWALERCAQHRDLKKISQSLIDVRNLDFSVIDQTLKQPLQLAKQYPTEILGTINLNTLKNMGPTLLGKRPLLQPDDHPEKTLVLPFPVLAELPLQSLTSQLADERKKTREQGLLLLEDLIGFFMSQNLSSISFIHTTYQTGQDVGQVLKELGEDAVKTALNGCRVIILDDSSCFEPGRVACDIRLALQAVQNALIAYVGKIDQCLRRSCSIVVRTHEIQNLADVEKFIEWGANAVVPYRINLV